MRPVGKLLSVVAVTSAVLGACAGLVVAKKVEITFATWGEPKTLKFHERMAANFEKLHPDIRVKCSLLGDWNTKVTTMFAAGVAPDVIWFDNYGLGLDWVSRGLLVPLDSYIKGDKLDVNTLFSRVAMDAQRYDGKTFGYRGTIYGLPKGINTDGLWYNKRPFDKAGVPYPSAAWTWDDLLEAGKKLTVYDAAGLTTQVGLGYEGDVWNWIYQAGGRLSDDTGKMTMNTPEVTNGLQFWADLSLRYRISPFPGMKGISGSPRDWMGKDKTAMAVSAAWWPIQYKDVAHIGVARLPKGKKSTSIMYTGGIGITKQSKHRAQAWEWIKFYTLNKQANIDHAGILEEWPPSMEVCRMPEIIRPKAFGLDLDRSALLDQFDSATMYIAPPSKPKRINDLMGPVFNDVKAGKTDAKTAIPALAKRIDEAIARK